MSQETIIANTEVSFKDFLFKNKRNRTILLIAAVAIVVQFAAFKYFYPFASFIHGDSFVYLDTAYHNFAINTYMVGYSRFLRLFSVFTSSDTALVAFQYILLQSSLLYFIFTTVYFYKPNNITLTLLLCFIVLNPLLLHLANLVSSDGFFLTISVIWITTLLWIVHRPNIQNIFWHALVIFLAFTIRYNALIYPFISAVAFGITKISKYQKLVGITSYSLLCVMFTLYTCNKYKELTGIWQYSPFSGWQMANNAMYAYRYVNNEDRKSVPEKYKVLDNMIRTYFDSTRNTRKFRHENQKAGTVYMWSPGLPLYKYRDLHFNKDSTATEFKKWASIGPFFSDYGLYIIKQYPWHYIKYFIWPNANKYYSPPIEFLEAYNMGRDSVNLIAKVWFGYKSTKVSSRIKDTQAYTLKFYPILTGVMNVVFLVSLIWFIILNGFRKDKLFGKGMIIATTVWLSNAGFTIFASSAALRFQSFPIILVCIFTFLLVDWMCKIMTEKKIINPTFIDGMQIRDATRNYNEHIAISSKSQI